MEIDSEFEFQMSTYGLGNNRTEAKENSLGALNVFLSCVKPFDFKLNISKDFSFQYMSHIRKMNFFSLNTAPIISMALSFISLPI